jgi:hypothetical protein
MGEISSLVAALAALGLVRAWDAAEEDRTSRQEGVFVPFNLPPLSPREQPTRQSEIGSAMAASASGVPTAL